MLNLPLFRSPMPASGEAGHSRSGLRCQLRLFPPPSSSLPASLLCSCRLACRRSASIFFCVICPWTAGPCPHCRCHLVSAPCSRSQWGGRTEKAALHAFLGLTLVPCLNAHHTTRSHTPLYSSLSPPFSLENHPSPPSLAQLQSSRSGNGAASIFSAPPVPAPAAARLLPADFECRPLLQGRQL